MLDPETDTASYHPMSSNTRGQQHTSFRKGRPCAYTIQTRSNAARLWPVPDDVYKVVMVVARKPLNKLVNSKDIPEIDEDYHLGLCDYAAWRALTNNDPEGANMAAADKFFGAWSLMVRDAKRDLRRMRAGQFPQARDNWTGKRARF